MIASVQFKNFKALRAASLRLGPFNLVIGPAGSGKTSLIQALLKLRALSATATGPARGGGSAGAEAAGSGPPSIGLAKDGLPSTRPVTTSPNETPEIIFRFAAPFADIEAHLGCRSEMVCDLLELRHANTAEARARAGKLREQLGRIRAYLLDHYAMAGAVAVTEGDELAANGHNLAAVLAALRAQQPKSFARLEEDFCRTVPEFSGVVPQPAGKGQVAVALRLAEGGEVITAENLSQGALYLLAVLALSFAPRSPAVLCIEEADRGVHPRLLRPVRDALYRLSHPEAFGEKRPPVQIVATTHSPYLVDLFREHPEEIVVASKRGRAATFERLSDRPDVKEILAEGSLGDIWYSGILGGVPEE